MKFTWLTYFVAINRCDNRKRQYFDEYINGLRDDSSWIRETKQSIRLKKHRDRNRKKAILLKYFGISAHF